MEKKAVRQRGVGFLDRKKREVETNVGTGGGLKKKRGGSLGKVGELHFEKERQKHVSRSLINEDRKPSKRVKASHTTGKWGEQARASEDKKNIWDHEDHLEE